MVTRARDQAGELVRLLESLGAEVFAFFATMIVGVEDPTSLDAALRRVAEFDWIIFTSGNAVHFVAERCTVLGIDPKRIQTPAPRIAAVGESTAGFGRRVGLRLDYVAAQQTALGLAKELSHELNGCKILLPRGDHAGPEIPSALRDAGAQVTEVLTYRTVGMDHTESQLREVVKQSPAAMCFASPSAFRYFMKEFDAATMKHFAENSAFASIGPTTTAAIRSAGFQVQIQAAAPTMPALVEAIEHYFVHDCRTGIGAKTP
ncbi:MAG: uroporphyrinogen-III synthase [Candidatus Acidiferrales bacterium]